MMSGSFTTRTRTGASRRTSPRRCRTKLHELQRLWIIEATRYNVLPIDDRLLERVNPDLAGRPVLVEGKTQVLFGGMGHLSENCVLSIKNKSHSITAEIVVPEKGAEGVIIAQGANIGGWSLYAKDGKLKYCYNWGGFKHFMVEATTPIPAGEHQVRMEFAYAGGGLGKGGKVTLYTDGKKVGEGNVEATLANIFSADDGCDVGEDTGAPVSPDYGPQGNAFNGEVKGVQLAIADAAENADHLVDPEDCHPRRHGAAVDWRASKHTHAGSPSGLPASFPRVGLSVHAGSCMKRYVPCICFALTLAAGCTSDPQTGATSQGSAPPTTQATGAGDPLPSWNEGRTKNAIRDFVGRVTKEGSSDFVPVPERIATFDNDGRCGPRSRSRSSSCSRSIV